LDDDAEGASYCFFDAYRFVQSFASFSKPPRSVLY
jgi:hypothetical protein